MEVTASRRAETLLAAAALVLLASWIASKLLFFRNLMYYGSDFFSFLQMSKSFRYTGRLLWENVYGDHAVIHNFYAMLLYFPLTYAFGGYGLVLGLGALYVLAALVVLRTPVLALPGRVAVLAVLLSPIGFWVFDNPTWGFHPELAYPALGLLLALWLLEGRYLAATLAGLVIAASREDGPLVCAAVLLPYFLARLWEARHDVRRRRHLVRVGVATVGACGLVFLAGLAWLYALQGAAPTGQLTAPPRLRRALVIMGTTLLGGGDPDWPARLGLGLGGLAAVAASAGLLVGRRLAAYAALLVPGIVLLVPILVIASGLSGFGLLLWPPRVATFLAPVLASVAIVAAVWPEAPRPPRRVPPAWALAVQLLVVAGVWAGHLALLAWLPFDPRTDLTGLKPSTALRGRLRAEELTFIECLADRLPRDFPVASAGPQTPLFHRQAIVFPHAEASAWEPARLRVGLVGTAGPGALGQVGRVRVEGRPELAALVHGCAARSR